LTIVLGVVLVAVIVACAVLAILLVRRRVPVLCDADGRPQ
jgi:hypothetical protein